jgi:hypothetical protein
VEDDRSDASNRRIEAIYLYRLDLEETALADALSRSRECFI